MGKPKLLATLKPNLFLKNIFDSKKTNNLVVSIFSNSLAKFGNNQNRLKIIKKIPFLYIYIIIVTLKTSSI